MTRLTLVSLLLVMNCSLDVFGQANIQTITGAEVRARQSKMAPGDSFDLIAMRELMSGAHKGAFGITDEQVRELAALNAQLAKWVTAELEERAKEHGGVDKIVTSNHRLLLSLQREAEDAAMKKWVESMQRDVLLPFQNEQLKATCIANVRAQLGDKELFAMPWVRKELDISDEQLKRINAKIDEEAEKLEAETKRLMALLEEARSEAMSGILSELTPSQREKAVGLFPGFKPEEIAK